MSSSQKPCRHLVASSFECVVVTTKPSQSEELAVGHVLECVSGVAREEVKVGMGVCRFTVEVSVEESVLERDVDVQVRDRFRGDSRSEFDRVVESVDIV